MRVNEHTLTRESYRICRVVGNTYSYMPKIVVPILEHTIPIFEPHGDMKLFVELLSYLVVQSYGFNECFQYPLEIIVFAC